jgi:uncharacterized membrane protein YphA (DoxX/SURF4 family)
MKKINIIYWISTVLLCIVMGGSGVVDVINGPDAKKFMEEGLHYPSYFTVFIGVAKILGSIAILVPGFNKLKEWVYAGFTFDLIGAAWSGIAVSTLPMGTTLAQISPMLLFFALLVVSYIYHQKRLAAKQTA